MHELQPNLARGGLSSGPAIRVEGVSKCFKVYHRPIGRLADLIAPRPGRYQEVWALRDISFTVERGECFGIIGANGSGKSTLLKLITQTLLPTAGKISVSGRVLALLELGGGINPELTGRENVAASANLLGFEQGYAAGKTEEIKEFADIGDFFDRPMRIYSSGMYVRLAFSIYLFMNPDILIVDEALSVGDVFFQQKCYAALRGIMQRGVTVLFVSHDAGAIQRLCNRSMMLNAGRVNFVGLPDEAVNRYHSLMGARAGKHRRQVDNVASDAAQVGGREAGIRRAQAVLAANAIEGSPLRSPAGTLTLSGLRAVDADDQPTALTRIGDTLRIDLVIDANAAVARPDATFALYDRFGVLVFRTSAARLDAPLAAMAAGDRNVVTIAILCSVQTGHYTYRIGLRDDLDDPIDRVAESGMIGPIIIHWDRPVNPFYGRVGLSCRLTEASAGAH